MKTTMASKPRFSINATFFRGSERPMRGGEGVEGKRRRERGGGERREEETRKKRKGSKI